MPTQSTTPPANSLPQTVWSQEMQAWVKALHQHEPSHEFLHWTVSGAHPRLSQAVCDLLPVHYLTRLLDLLNAHGAVGVRGLLQIRMPSTERGRSGNFAEIIAIETLRLAARDFEFPINRLCWAECPLPMRGDDIIGFKFEAHSWKMLKGESKGGRNVRAGVVKEARRKLNEHGGRPSPHSLTWCADRLREMQRDNDALTIEKAQIGTGLQSTSVEHAIFVTSGIKSAEMALRTDTEASTPPIRRRGFLTEVPDYTSAMKAAYTLPPAF